MIVIITEDTHSEYHLNAKYFLAFIWHLFI